MPKIIKVKGLKLGQFFKLAKGPKVIYRCNDSSSLYNHRNCSRIIDDYWLNIKDDKDCIIMKMAFVEA